jgi:hypothetical protein
VTRKRGRKMRLAVKKRKNPTVIGGATETTICADTQLPPQKIIAKINKM